MIATLFAIAFFIVLGGIFTFTTLRSRSRNGLKDGASMEAGPFAVFSIADAFDPDYAIIWDTQLPALQLINKAGAKGMGPQQLHRSYFHSARRYPELYDGTSFERWLEFLETEKLIATRSSRVFITAEGHKFLEYRLVPQVVLTT